MMIKKRTGMFCMIALLGVICGLCFTGMETTLAADTAPSPDSTDVPVAFLPETGFTFKPVMEGETVKHAFSILNKGSQTLNIKNVSGG